MIMEIYKQREYDLQNEIDNILGINGTFQNYKDEVNRFIDNLLNETIEINTLRHSVKEKDKEIERLNNIINELEKYHIKSMKNLENTEDFKYIGTNYIKILYEEHKRTLAKLKTLKEGK